LPASLLLLILSLDVPGILRLGWKAIAMLLAGTLGVVVGGPLALLICKHWLPDNAWQAMAPLAGSWIGGGANMIAIKQAAGTTDAMLSPIIVVDVLVANIWMGVLLFCAPRQHRIDRRMRANAEAIRDLEQRMTDFQERVTRVPALAELIIMLGLAFTLSWLSFVVSRSLPEIASRKYGTIIADDTWKYIVITTIGVILSFTRMRNLEGAGASKLGSVMIYLLVACIGAGANFHDVVEKRTYIAAGFIWMAVHITFLLTTARLIRAPVFFVAVGSQANIGGAASAPVVAAAFHPSLAAVGALLAVAGYVLGTYAGVVCMHLLRLVGG